MIALHRQSIRSTIRVVTLLAAVAALLLTLVPPFVGTAEANGTENKVFAGFIDLSNGETIDLGDPNDPTTWTSGSNNVAIAGYEWQGPENPLFHLSCSQTIEGTQVKVVGTGDIVDIQNFAIYRGNAGQNLQTLGDPLCTDDSFGEPDTWTLTVDKSVIDPGQVTDGTEVYTFTVVCTDDTNDSLTITGAGTDSVTGITEGATCDITETGDGGADDTMAGLAANPTTKTTTLDDVAIDGNTTVYFVNTYDAPGTWTLTVDKSVVDNRTGDDPDATYTFDVDCTDGTDETVTITGEGTESVSGVDEDATCTVVEAGTGGADSTSSGTTEGNLSVGTTIQGVGEGDTAYFVNTYDGSTPPPPPPPPGDVDGSGTVVKDWEGDAIPVDDVTVTFTANIDGGTSFTMAPDDTVVLDLGETLTITDEDVDGLPSNCSYVSDLPVEGASFRAASQDPDGTITITNSVDCRATGTVEKVWNGEEFDGTGVTVTFTANVNGGESFTLEPGDVEPLGMGDVLTITGEDVEGLPATCAYVSDLPDEGLTFTATQDDPDGVLTIVNTVDCTDVGGEVVVNVLLEKVWQVSGPASVADAFDTDAIDVTFTLDGYAGAYRPGDEVTATPGDVLRLTEEMGDLPDGTSCEVTAVLVEPYTVTNAVEQVLTVTNVVECAEVKGVVVALPATGANTATWALIAGLFSGLGALLLLASQGGAGVRRH